MAARVVCRPLTGGVHREHTCCSPLLHPSARFRPPTRAQGITLPSFLDRNSFFLPFFLPRSPLQP